ncbi:uncharacterized protein LOC110944221 [Helianthus annuus]|uniref:uncharacterized protein LOC110944221 n=1 Tax=Helianthus annuus TaxID=4232 RepID=UPI000B8F5C3A|nr:uncharacterized protein LOC110944221 [Helianthus annuus]
MENIVGLLSKVLLRGKKIHYFFKGIVGNGSNIRFWIDHWVGDGPLMDLWPSLFSLETDKSCRVNDRISVSGGLISVKWDWLRQPSSLGEVAELQGCSVLLEGLHMSDSRDKWRWTPCASGIYSTQSFKALSIDPELPRCFFSVKGSRWVPTKCNILVWRAALDRLPTKQALLRRNISVGSGLCGLCSEATESVDHLFTGCLPAIRLWSKFSAWVRLHPFFAFSFQDIVDMHKNWNGNKDSKEIVKGLIIITCWCIWKARNLVTFDNGSSNEDDIFREVKTLSFFWLKNRSSHGNLEWGEWCKFPLYMM